MCFGRTDGQSDHYRAFATIWRGPDNLLHGFFNINVPFGSDYFALISQHNVSVVFFEDLRIRNVYLNSFIGNPNLGLTHSRCKVLTVKCGIGMTVIGAAKCV
jgi:hypothetical protein